MRPHVEVVQQSDLVWHPAELFKVGTAARQKNLSYDEENGAASTRVLFDKAWNQPSGFYDADVEWFLLSGQIKVGGRPLGKGAYLRAPAGLCIPKLEVAAGTEVLIFREYGDCGFSSSTKNRTKHVPRGGNTASREAGELTTVDTARMEWLPNLYEGDTQRFLKVKALYIDPPMPGDNNSGFATVLAWSPPGWSDNRMVHHPVSEEGYCIDGDMDYNFGRLSAGAYFFRPAKVKHGHFVSGEEKGLKAIYRLEGSLINWITVDERVIMEGKAINYDPETEGPVLAGLPVRSRSTGEWSRDGQ